MELLLIILLVLFLFGGIGSFAGRSRWGPAPSGILGVLFVVVLVVLLLKVI